mmetsp:Transcript_70882/g.188619  ORF Transcript_70882/g.188619 Transcript_70882/m.188619 type:complete len:608 (+) Transcript_70882:129-1952(+)
MRRSSTEDIATPHELSRAPAASRTTSFFSGSVSFRGKRRNKPKLGSSEGQLIKILTFTWNVGNAMPDAEELAHWCPAGGSDYDIIAVGTQENSFKEHSAKGRNASSVEMNNAKELDVDDDDKVAEGGGIEMSEISLADGSTKGKPSTPAKRAGGNQQRTVWDTMVQERLGSEYVVVHHIVLWEMRLTIYARKALWKGGDSSIFGVESGSSATGIAGVLGNKGGLVVKLNLGYTSIVFVSCHLAAHSHKNKERNENCKEILHETREAIGTNQLDICSEFDHVFWMGDLNYRVDLVGVGKTAGISEDEHLARVKLLVEKQDWEALMAADQLKESQRQGAAFAGFSEGSYEFAPTFKVKRQPDTVHKDQRIPSYCDRVLWKSMHAGRVKQTMLKSLPAISTSDHKPVVAGFEVVPSVGLLRINRSMPVLRASGFQVTGLVSADMTGGSDPYLVFFTNPPEVLSPHSQAPISKVKSVTTTTKKASKDEWLSWTERELPLMRPLVELEDLKEVTLIIAIFDHDLVGKDDLLGVCLVPLADPAATGGERYDIEIDQPITLYSSTKETGYIKGRLSIAGGSQIDSALQAARDSQCGADSSQLHRKFDCGSCTIA